MTIQRRRNLLGASAAITALGMVPRTSSAQAYPNRPLKIVIGFPPGATSDLLARTIADKLGPVLGQTVLVDNKPGASTILASQLVVNSPPDGYTFFINLALHFQNQLLYKNMPYDIFKDFANVTDICYSPVMLIINGSNPAKTVKEFIEWGRGRKLAYASWGNGSTGHILGHLFSKQHGLDATHIAYKGGAAAVTEDVAGRAIAPGGIRQLASLAPLDKLLHRLRRISAVDDQHHRRITDVGDVGEVLEDVVRQILVEQLVLKMQRQIDEEGVAVRRRFGHQLARQNGGCAGFVVHQHRLAEYRAQLVGDSAREQIAGGAGWKTDDDF